MDPTATFATLMPCSSRLYDIRMYLRLGVPVVSSGASDKRMERSREIDVDIEIDRGMESNRDTRTRSHRNVPNNNKKNLKKL